MTGTVLIEHIGVPKFNVDDIKADGGAIPLYVPNRLDVPPGQTISFTSDIILTIPDGCVAIIYPMKRLGLMGANINAPLIKSNWHKQFTVNLSNNNPHHILEVLEGEQIAQIIIVPILNQFVMQMI